MESIAITQKEELELATFQVLGESIRKKWVSYSYNADAFAEIAAEQLANAKLHQTISVEDILTLPFEDTPATAGYQFDSPFGDLQQIVYKHEKFYIEALYWLDGTTNIHDHSFSGAFALLSGSSINVEYYFEQEKKINHHFSIGHLSEPLITKLSPGSVKPIYSGSRFIHSVFHLENPTISIVVRTNHEDDALPQHEYRGNRIRLVQQILPVLIKKIQGLRILKNVNTKQFCHYFKRTYLESTIDERYWLIRSFYANLAENLLWDFIKQENNNYEQILLDAIAEEAINYKTMQVRYHSNDSQLKLFLALLLNLPTWHSVAEFIKNYYKFNPDIFLSESLATLKSANILIPDKVINFSLAEPITDENAIYYLLLKKRVFDE